MLKPSAASLAELVRGAFAELSDVAVVVPGKLNLNDNGGRPVVFTSLLARGPISTGMLRCGSGLMGYKPDSVVWKAHSRSVTFIEIPGRSRGRRLVVLRPDERAVEIDFSPSYGGALSQLLEVEVR
jgi:hypothetical protein